MNTHYSTLKNMKTQKIKQNTKIVVSACLLLVTMYTMATNSIIADLSAPRSANTQVACYQDIANLYRPLLSNVSVSQLRTKLDAQHLAEIFTFRAFCDVAQPSNPSSYYVPLLPLVAWRLRGETNAKKLAEDSVKILQKQRVGKRGQTPHFTVCNHWAAPALLQTAFQFDDDSTQFNDALENVLLYTFEEDFYLEMAFQKSKHFSKMVRAVPYVSTALTVSVPVGERSGFFFSGSSTINKNTEEERRGGSIRSAIVRAGEHRDDIVAVNTDGLREKEVKCDPAQLEREGRTWTQCGTGDFGSYQWTHDGTGAKGRAGVGFADANFCLCPRGDTPGSARIFDALAAGCVPIIISDAWAAPFSMHVQWTELVLRIREKEFLENPSAALSAVIVGVDIEQMRLNIERWAPTVLFAHPKSRVQLQIALDAEAYWKKI